MIEMLLASLLLAPPFIAAPDAYGSKDGRIKAKNPLQRRAGKAEREALDRADSNTADLRVPVLIGNLSEEDLARLPAGVDLAALIGSVFAESKGLRPVYVENCIESDCLREQADQELSKHLSQLAASEGGVSEDGSIVAVSAAAKARDRLAVISLSLDDDRRLTILLFETPGRGLLGQIVSDPLEAQDTFETAFQEGLGRLLRLGSPEEGLLEPLKSADPTSAQGEPAHVLAFRQDLKAKSKYGLYGGAGAAGVGFLVGVYAAVNAYRWRRLSYREPEYREQFRSAVAGQALFADLLMVGGGAVAGAAYWARGHADQVGAFSWLAGDAPPPTKAIPTHENPTSAVTDQASPVNDDSQPVEADGASRSQRKLMR